MDAHVAVTVVRLGLVVVGAAALAYWGATTGRSRRSKLVLGLGAPLAALAVWAGLGAPDALLPLATSGRVIVRFVFVGAVVLALLSLRHPLLGAGVALVYVLNSAAVAIWDP